MAQILYIPGFMGNELHVAGQKRPQWTLDRAMTGRTDILDLERYPADMVYSGKPIQFVYTSHLNQLKRAGHDVLFFGYDWRLPIQRHLTRLHRFIKSNLVDTPFHIISHSTGGLIAALYLREFGAGNCSVYIGCGVPVTGVDYAAKSLIHGDEKMQKLLPLTDSQVLLQQMRQLPVLYELLPAELFQTGRETVDRQGVLHKDMFQQAGDTRGALDDAFARMEAGDVPARFVCEFSTDMEVLRCDAEGNCTFEKGRGDGWIADHRSYPFWADPIALELQFADFALIGPLGVLAKYLAPHPLQPAFPSVHKAIAEILSKK